jgi:hypothetical protein
MTSRSFTSCCATTLFLALAVPVCSVAIADPVPATAAVPSGKLVSSFSDFAGSPENSASLVNGLRSGTPITLTDPAVAGGPPPVSTTFTSPTKPMGYGNVRIALSLAQAQLASQGISNPTATELQGALMGSTVVGPGGTTTTDGILQMRASGMGWGQIANANGVKLGPVISGHQTVVAPATTNSGVTTAAGGTHGSGNAAAVKSKSVVTGSGNATHGQSSGITTGLGHASANAGGVVTAAGGKAGGNAGGVAGSNAGGNGRGVGKP